MEYLHGGDVYTYAGTHGGQLPIDLSASINPYGPPESVRQAMHDAIGRCMDYPDPFCRAARKAIGEREGVNPDWLYCGNGASDVLDRLAFVLRPRKALLTAPTFSEYERSLPGCDLCFHMLRPEEGFKVTETILPAISNGVEAVYLCNPNNPTGRTVAPGLMKEILLRCKGEHSWLIVDECFADFLTDCGSHSLTGSLGQYDRLVIVRSYTKMYAVPGIRFGWLMTANPPLIKALYRAGQPWNVSSVSQACAEYAAKEEAFARAAARRIAEERACLKDGLQRAGCFVFPGEANFLLFQSQDRELADKLARQGILIRDCSNYRGLCPGYYRTAVKTRADSQALIRALMAIQEKNRGPALVYCDFGGNT